MNVRIEKNKTRTWLKLPCSEQEMQDALKAVQSMSVLDTNVLIAEVDDAFDELQKLVGQQVNLDHLNFLARCIDGMYGGEVEQFRAALHVRGVTDIQTMVNTTQELCNYTVVPPDASLKSIGRYHYMNLHGGCMMMEDETKIDFAAIARELIASGKGMDSPYGIVFINDLEPSFFFNGTNIPCYYDRPFVISCYLKNGDSEEHLFLPCHENEIAKALYRLGASDISECTVEIENYEFRGKFSKLIDSIEEYDFYDMNRLTHEVQDFVTNDLEKLAVLYEYTQDYADPEPVYALTRMAEYIDSFRFIPDIDNTEALGTFLIQKSGEYYYDSRLGDYYNYEQLGEDKVEEERGKFLDSGYVGIKDDIDITEIIEESGPKMGGMT